MFYFVCLSTGAKETEVAKVFFFIVGLSVKGCETMHFTLDGETLPFILSSSKDC